MMSENSTCGIANETAMSAAAVAEDGSTKSYLELPPLVEDNEGIGTVMEIEKPDITFSMDVPGPYDVHAWQADHVGNDSQRMAAMKLLDARREYEVALARLIARVECALQENKDKQAVCFDYADNVPVDGCDIRGDCYCWLEVFEIIHDQKTLQAELKRAREQDDFIDKKKVPLQLFFPPYFRDMYDMVPTVNSEARRRTIDGVYDSLIREEKKWTQTELKKLRVAVLKSVLEKRLEPFVERRQCIIEKIRQSGRETTEEDKEEWRQKAEGLNRAIQYQLSLPEEEILSADKTDYSEVDWLKISNIDFLGIRTPKQVRLKWMYEQSPQWSKAEWSWEELRKLYSLRKESCIDWSIVADDMGAQRTPYQCLEKYKTAIGPLLYSKPWTKQEDSRLSILVKALQNNADVPWSVVSVFMDGRSQYESRNRYEQFSLSGRNYGKWNVAEDVALLCAVARYGTRDWTRVANMLVSRSRTQCRERWVNMFSKRVVDTPWTLAEDEKLLYGIKVFGKGKWTQISALLPGRSANDCKMRFRSLVNTKLKIYTNNWNYSLVRGDTTASRRRRRQKVGEHFAELVRVDEEDVKADRIVGEFDEAMGEDKELRMRLKPERRNAITRAVEEINKRASNGGSLETWFALLDDLRITSDMLDDTTLSIVKRYCDEESISSLRDRRTILSAEEQTRFNSSLKELPDDQAKIQFITDSLFELVLRADEKRQCDDDPFRRPNVNEEVYRYFDHNLIDALLSHLENGTKPSPILPCVATLEILDQIKALMPNLCFEALLLFNPIVWESNVPFIELSTQLKEDTEYQLLAMKLRSMLYLPMLMDRAIEPESSWRIRSVHHEIAKKQRREAAAYRRASSTQSFESSNLLGSPAKRELTVRDVVMRNLPLDKLMSAVHGNEERVQTLATYLASEKKEISTADEQRLAKLDESIESVRAKVKNMAPEEFMSYAKPISSTCCWLENVNCPQALMVEGAVETATLKEKPLMTAPLRNDDSTAVGSNNVDVKECPSEQASSSGMVIVEDKGSEAKKARRKRAVPTDCDSIQKRTKQAKISARHVKEDKQIAKQPRAKCSAAENTGHAGTKRSRAQEQADNVSDKQADKNNACERIKCTKWPKRRKVVKAGHSLSNTGEAQEDSRITGAEVHEPGVSGANVTSQLPGTDAEGDSEEQISVGGFKMGTDGAGTSSAVLPALGNLNRQVRSSKKVQYFVQRKSLRIQQRRGH